MSTRFWIMFSTRQSSHEGGGLMKFTQLWLRSRIKLVKYHSRFTLTMLKNKCFSIRFFLDFLSFWLPKTKAKLSNLRIFIENVNFVKIIVFLTGNSLFFWFGASENPPKLDAQTQWKITSKKKPWKSNLGSHLVFQKPWKWAPAAM